MTTAQIVFLLLAFVAIVSAFGVVCFKNAVHAALSLVLTFFTLAMLYFNLGAPMVGVSQIMVYAGAIMVLFLFVIMMLKLGGNEPKEQKYDMRVIPAIVIAIGLGAVIFAKVMLPLIGLPIKATEEVFGEPQQIGWALPTTYVWPFMVASILLLVGVVGSIMLVRGRAR